MPPRIEAERLVLTPEKEKEKDAEWFTELLNARGGGTFTTEEARERIAVMTATIGSIGIGALLLRTRPDGDALGYTAIVNGRGSLDEPELAYELLPRAQDQGYAAEASHAVGGHLHDRPRRIWSTVRSWNAPSFRVLDKLGSLRNQSTTDADGELVWLLCDR